MNLASEVAAAVEMGRESGWDDLRILKSILSGEFGGNHRREMVVFWGDAIGVEPKEALRRARAAGLIPTTQPPKSLREGTLQRRILEIAPE
jgi:hypothetical protein